MELSIDTASDLASLVLSREGEVAHERSWQCRRNHTVEVLPAIDAMLGEARVGKGDGGGVRQHWAECIRGSALA